MNLRKKLLLLLTLFASAAFLEQAAGAPEIWPVHYNAPPAQCRTGSFAEGFAYHSRSYVILSHESLSTGRINEMATVAESVHGVIRQFPLDLLPPPNNRKKNNGRNVIRILPTQENYQRAGGPAGSSGYFNPHSGEVIVSLAYLIEPKGPRSNLEPRQRYRLLVHELVHQAMAENSVRLPLWFSEGFAEYLSSAQFAPGRYRFDASPRDIINHMRTVWIHDRRNSITIPTIESLVQLDSRAWGVDNRTNRYNAYAKYAGSLLLTHYQLELAKRNLGGLRGFLKETTSSGNRGRMKHHPRHYRGTAPDHTALWKDRPPSVVQRQLAAYWKSKGLHLKFAPLQPLKKRGS